MSYRYFIFYEVKQGNTIGHFNTCLDLSRKITDMSIITEIQDYIANQFPDAETVLISNWQFMTTVHNGKDN